MGVLFLSNLTQSTACYVLTMYCKIKCDLNIATNMAENYPKVHHSTQKSSHNSKWMWYFFFVELSIWYVAWNGQMSTFFPADCVEEFISKDPGFVELRIKNVWGLCSVVAHWKYSHIPRLNAVEQRLIVGQKCISLFCDNMKRNNVLYINTIKLLNDEYIKNQCYLKSIGWGGWLFYNNPTLETSK